MKQTPQDRRRFLRRQTTALLVALVLLPFVVPRVLKAQEGRFDLEALSRLVRVSDPQISPDGRAIVLVVSRKKVAAAGAAVTDFTDQCNLADFNVQARWSFGGSPWTGGREKAYLEQSPITYASRIRTPTLILSTTGDVRVPVTQSYRLYHALKDNGVSTRLIAWPVPGHFPADPVRARSVYREWIGWLDAHLTRQAEAGAARYGK